jgi:hypothetical protein
MIVLGAFMSTKGFTFDASKSFDDNFEAFLVELESVDKEMAAILRANVRVLAKVVRDGERDSNARAAFNTEVAKALDALVAPPASGNA